MWSKTEPFTRRLLKLLNDIINTLMPTSPRKKLSPSFSVNSLSVVYRPVYTRQIMWDAALQPRGLAWKMSRAFPLSILVFVEGGASTSTLVTPAGIFERGMLLSWRSGDSIVFTRPRRPRGMKRKMWYRDWLLKKLLSTVYRKSFICLPLYFPELLRNLWVYDNFPNCCKKVSFNVSNIVSQKSISVDDINVK